MTLLINRPFEYVSSSVGATADELKLIFSFVLSYPLAGVLKRIPDSKPQFKNAFIIGVSVFYIIGLLQLYDGLRTILVSSLGAYAIATYLRSSVYMPWVGFAFLMGHMSVSHIWRQTLGHGADTADITGAQMVLVMKLSAFCWNVADGQLPDEELSDFQRDRRLKELPRLVDYAGYVLFFPSVLVGPAFDYAEYRRWIDTTMFDVPSNVDPSKKPPVRKKRRIPRSGTPAMWTALTGLAWLGLYMAFGGRFGHQQLLSDSYRAHSLLYRVWVMYMVNITARLKYYGVWSLTEGSCILAGLGYNGVDPVTGKVSWNRLQNINPWMVETAQNPRAYLGGWNMNTNNWLRNYVYLRVTPKGKKPGFRASLMTFGTSAFWHGFYPGYYLTFVLASLIQTAAKNFRRQVRPFFLDPITQNPTPQKRIYDFLCLLVTQLFFSFTTTPFLVLGFTDSLRAWSAVYFYPVVLTAFSLVFFASPGKVWLKRTMEKRMGRATEHERFRMSRSVSADSLSGGQPILGISKDPEQDISEAMEEIRAEVEARQKGEEERKGGEQDGKNEL